MKKEYDEWLCKNFPKLYKDRKGNMKETLMCWGFEIGDGWYPIIKSLSYAIQGHIDNRTKNIRDAKKWNKQIKDPAWRPTWWGKSEDIPVPKEVEQPVKQVTVVQVKEKFGTLRFYYDGGDDIIHNYVSMAEIMSGFVCDQCGAPAETGGKGWVTTRCEPCIIQIEEERAAENAAWEAKQKAKEKA